MDQDFRNEETYDYALVEEQPKKTVVFDEVVKEMEIERVKDDDDVFNEVKNDVINDVETEVEIDDGKKETVVEMETIPNKSMFFDEVVKELKVDTFNNPDDVSSNIENLKNESDL